MASKKRVWGILAVVFGLILAGCPTEADNTSNDEKITNEQVFANVWVYFGCPDVRTINSGRTKAFAFYEGEGLDSADLNAVQAYWKSLPDDKTFFDRISGPIVGEKYSPNLKFDLHLKREDNGTTSFRIELIYPNGENAVFFESLSGVVPGKVLEITHTMVDCVK
jgi:hypothetical protein